MVRVTQFVKRGQLDSRKTLIYGLPGSCSKALRATIFDVPIDVRIQLQLLAHSTTKDCGDGHV